MADNKSDLDRSRNMAAVRSRNTRPELRLRKELWWRGLRFFTSSGWKRLTGTPLPGTPDLIFPRSRIVVFVDGCFWHGCPVHYTAPDDNAEFWKRKLHANLDRDRQVNSRLISLGWTVLRVWEHDLRKSRISSVLMVIEAAVRKEEGVNLGGLVRPGCENLDPNG